MHSTIMDPTVGTFVGFIVEPIDVLAMDIHIPMGAITADIAIISLNSYGGYYPYSYGGYRPHYFGPYRRHVRRVYRRAYRRGYY